MAKKISELTAASSLVGTEEFETNQGGTSKKATAAQIAALASGGTVTAPKYTSGRWYSVYQTHTSQAGAAPASNTIRAIPFLLSKSVTISDLMARITTAAAGGNMQLAIYASDSAGKPTGNALATTASISMAATGPGSATLATPVTLPSGLYWAMVAQDNTTGVVHAPGMNPLLGLYGSTSPSTIASAGPPNQMVINQTFGTWPDFTSLTMSESTTVGSAVLYFKVA